MDYEKCKKTSNHFTRDSILNNTDNILNIKSHEELFEIFYEHLDNILKHLNYPKLQPQSNCSILPLAKFVLSFGA